MQIRTKRLDNGFEMPEYGLGTWQMGGRGDHDPNNDDAADVRAIEAAIEHGVTHIDTAELYAAGHAEELVGRAIKRFDRDKLFVVSKVLPVHARAKDVRKSVEGSLRRIGTDYLDLYLLHSFAHDVPLDETMGALNDLVEDELVRFIGVSNFTSSSMANAQQVSAAPLVVNQLHYNLAVRTVEQDGLLSFCQKNDAFLMAWRPVNFDSDVELLDEMAEKYGKAPVQIALNWLVSQDNVITLSKTRDEKHLIENLGAFGWQMDVEDIERLRSDYPNQTNVSGVVLA